MTIAIFFQCQGYFTFKKIYCQTNLTNNITPTTINNKNMKRMNLKKTSAEIGELLNVADAYAYKVLKKYLENANRLPTEKVRGRKIGEGRRLPQTQSEEMQWQLKNFKKLHFQKLPRKQRNRAK
ncbi:MAG: hypothetical protein IK062_11295 [Selenomonadaceae bacterium]|nr:hypothetical protein [Selenomonadaceae bacterium]